MENRKYKKDQVTLVLMPADSSHWNLKALKKEYPNAEISFAGEKYPCTKEELKKQFPELKKYLN